MALKGFLLPIVPGSNLISKDPTSNGDEFLSGLIVALGPEGKLYSPNNYTIVYQSLTITSFTNKIPKDG